MSNRIKILSVILAASLVLSVSGCTESSSRSRRDRDDGSSSFEGKDPSEETEQSTVIETTAVTTETTAEPTETTATSDDGTDQFNYYIFMNYAILLHEENPDYLFGFERNYTDHSEWTLVVSDPDAETSDVYIARDGVQPELYETRDFITSNASDYDLFIQLPCMTEIGHCEGRNDIYDAPSDGRYFGSVLAVYEDGTYILVKIGEAIEITEAEYNALEVGDIIPGHPNWNQNLDLVVTDITGSGADREVEVCDGEMWFSHGYAENSSDYVLTEASDNPVYSQTHIYALPIAENCEVTDTFSFLAGDIVFEVDPNASPLVNSNYWHFSTEIDPYRTGLVNSWYEVNGLAYPVVIEDGEVASINLEWR